MAFDRKYIFDKVNFHLKQENAFFTSAEIHMIIGVDSFKRIAEDLSYPKSNYSGGIASGVWTISVPSDFIKIDETSEVVFKDVNGLNTLDPATKTSIGRDVMLSATAGTPQSYFMENESTIGVYPPSTSGVIVIPYVKEPTSLSSDTDTNQLTGQCYMAAVYWTVNEAFSKDGDQRADKYLLLYEKEINRLKGRFGEMYEVPRDIAPHEDYLR